MNNSLQVPLSAAETTEKPAQNKSDKFLLLTGLVCSLVAALIPILIVPQFLQIFKSLGTQLPPLTDFVLNYHNWLWALPVLVIAARLSWPNIQRRPLASCLIGAIGFILMIPVVVLALYLPIFKLGSVV